MPPTCHVFWEVGRVREHRMGYTNASREPEAGCGLPTGRPLIPLQPLIWAWGPAKALWFSDLVNLGCGQARDPWFPGPALTTPKCQAHGQWRGQLVETNSRTTRRVEGLPRPQGLQRAWELPFSTGLPKAGQTLQMTSACHALWCQLYLCGLGQMTQPLSTSLGARIIKVLPLTYL